jgi:hypothetical protein
VQQKNRNHFGQCPAEVVALIEGVFVCSERPFLYVVKLTDVFHREFVRKKERVHIDEKDLFVITDKDIENELEAIIKHTSRIEKNLQRLTEEEKRLIEQEDTWASELEKLVCVECVHCLLHLGTNGKDYP